MQLEFSVHCVQGKTINDLNEYIFNLNFILKLHAFNVSLGQLNNKL